eukprot:1621859-Amphidinium_carterae.1
MFLARTLNVFPFYARSGRGWTFKPVAPATVLDGFFVSAPFHPLPKHSYHTRCWLYAFHVMLTVIVVVTLDRDSVRSRDDLKLALPSCCADHGTESGKVSPRKS